jgi:thiosulfate reductase cytochrome b subunit
MPKTNEKILEKIWFISQDNQKELSKISGHVGILNQEMSDVKNEIQNFKQHYVKREEFSPIQKIVYTAVGVVLMAVLTALISLVILK